MSYDLEAFRVPPEMTPDEFYASEEREAASLEDEAPPTADERAAMERLADALEAIDPTAERADGDTFIEINTESLQVSLYPNEAAVTIPYWFEGDEADAVMERAFEYARVLRDVGGYTVYDPQNEQVVGDERGTAAETYRGTMGAVRRIGEEVAPKRRGWKFWQRS